MITWVRCVNVIDGEAWIGAGRTQNYVVTNVGVDGWNMSTKAHHADTPMRIRAEIWKTKEEAQAFCQRQEDMWASGHWVR